ncbi:Ribonuclease MRP protein subunit rmp1 [Elasticomyces elasticus]|uniref:RNase MRP subunit n=1 Tax=Exophiala sideris TaxID=1016849 RepID=A0ABR0JKY1_9EURO|nr:Ribonuclease MRP protein subunit rmp1 [Elasticomyces elasticus]KAK5032274.1 Ribonuclease MRP protein subunit rmp1 [Exophiala sideris]KAK5036272.1 RNase MRP subunit [Exophiala sideris]KAK5066655.1 RNase MRP subunit [Exophiala sideris]KAK5180477.1 RNase MRP subunit [Eurotiomycetes sp. CCFEE 6388]
MGMLRKAITTLIAFNDEEHHLRQQHGAGPAGPMDASQVRKRFEQESQIRRNREIWNEWIRETLLPRAYLGFTGLVADTQFAHLGVVLVGILADVMSVAGTPTALKGEQALRAASSTESRSKPTSLKATSLRVTGSQSGELVERMYDSDDMGEVIERTDADDGKPANVDDTRTTRAAVSLPHKASPHANDDIATDGIGQDMHIEDTPATTPSASKDESTIPTSNSRPTNSLSSRKSSKAPPAKSTSSKSTKDKTKKKGKKNAIDDLFAGLL